MSYPARRCPCCGHEIEDPTIPTVDTAIQREKELWRPFHDSWTENTDSTTMDINNMVAEKYYEIVYLDTKEGG